MAKNSVTLPALPSDMTYRAVPIAVTFHIDGASKVKTNYTFELIDGVDDSLSDRLLASAIRQGLVRFVGTATTSAKEGESEKQACDRRFDEMVAGSYKPGQGGGARLDTFTLVLRESVVTAVVQNLGLKKIEAVKLVKNDSKAAYLSACAKRAESMEGQTGDSIFDIMWPKIEKHAKDEAARRDVASKVDFDLGDFGE